MSRHEHCGNTCVLTSPPPGPRVLRPVPPVPSPAVLCAGTSDKTASGGTGGTLPGAAPALFAGVRAAILPVMLRAGAMAALCAAMSSAMLLVILLSVSGCGLTQPYPQRNLYIISSGEPATPAGDRTPSVLRIRPVRVAKPYDEKTFVYKTGESVFTVDYYNGFLADPSALLTGELAGWLSASGPFASVLGSTGADYDLTLEINVTALYGDYSEKASPKAVIEARFVLVREEKAAYKVVFEKMYRETEPLAGVQPDQLVRGFGQAYRRMLEELTTDLRTVAAPASRSANL
jgi:cholesterol transport system auxiliary component